MKAGLVGDVLALLLGFVTGVLSALFGIGGAIVSNPGLRALGASPLVAVGTTLPSILPGAISGTLRYRREGLIDWGLIAPAAAAGLLAVVGGSLLSHAVPGQGHLLLLLIAVLLAFTAWRTAFTGPGPEPEGGRNHRFPPEPGSGDTRERPTQPAPGAGDNPEHAASPSATLPLRGASHRRVGLPRADARDDGSRSSGSPDPDPRNPTSPERGPDPAQPSPDPAQPGPDPAQPDPEPAQPDPEPAQPDPDPAQAGPDPARPDSDPAEAGQGPPASDQPDPRPSASDRGDPGRLAHRQRWIAAGIGLVAGLLSGLLGIGGGVIMVPAFTELLSMSLKSAIATSLVCVGIFGVPATITHAFLGDVDWRLAILLAIGVIPGARVGAALTIRTAERRLRLAVGVFLGLVALVYFVTETCALLAL
jgi:uncharacterized membrane protein YfcA